MTNKGYLFTALYCLGNPHRFIESAKQMNFRYVVLHFMLILALLYLPIFILLIRTQPHELYSRVISQDFKGGQILYHIDKHYSDEYIDGEASAIYVFEDFVVYSGGNTRFSAPSEFFNIYNLNYSFDELFDMVAVYNRYVIDFLIPLLAISLIVSLILHGFFCVISVIFLGMYRLMSARLLFRERIKIVVMSTFPIAVCSSVVGIFLPAVHIIFFQLLNLLLLFFFFRRYDAVEKKLLEYV